MTKARDLADIISDGFTASDIPNLAGEKITSGTVAEARLPSTVINSNVDLTNLSASNLTSGTVDNARISLDANEIPSLDTAKVTSGTFADSRISESSVTQHVTATDLSSVENDIAVLALQNAINGNMTAHGLSNYWIEQFEDSDSISVSSAYRHDDEYMASGSFTATAWPYTNYSDQAFIDPIKTYSEYIDDSLSSSILLDNPTHDKSSETWCKTCLGFAPAILSGKATFSSADKLFRSLKS